jgi:formate hydrogenlyase subunit 3/multisubunit Na+/H+ antiporter MnhD subunit
MKAFYPNPEAGGVALEYIVVSIFGLLLALGAIAIVGKATQEKMAVIEQKLGIDLDLKSLNPLE